MEARAIIPILACVPCAAIAACGGSGTTQNPTVSKYGPRSSPFALSKCMRDNGVSSFPDPSSGPGGEGFPGGLLSTGIGTLVVDGVTIAGPAAKAAEQVCKIYLPPSGPPPQLSAARRAQMLAFARCMRAHGVPNFPDPTFGSGGGPVQAGSAKVAINQQSPAVIRAAQDCGGTER